MRVVSDLSRRPPAKPPFAAPCPLPPLLSVVRCDVCTVCKPLYQPVNVIEPFIWREGRGVNLIVPRPPRPGAPQNTQCNKTHMRRMKYVHHARDGCVGVGKA